MCLRVLKESNKRSFDSYSVRNSVLIISHITFRGCCGEFFLTTFLKIAVFQIWSAPVGYEELARGIGGNQKRQNILNEQYTELTYTFKYVMNL